MRHSGILACAAVLLLLFAGMPAWSATIAVNVSDANPTPANPCTLAQAIYAANLANNPGDATPAGATTINPLSDSTTTTTGSCSAGTSGANTIDLTAIAGQTITYSAADNFWYGPNALPPIASTIIIEGDGVDLVVPNTVVRLRFFFVGANPASAATPSYNTPGAGNLTLHNLSLSGGRQLGGGGGGSGSGGGGGGGGMGGAVFTQGTLTLDAVTLSGNRATGGGGNVVGHNGGGGIGADANYEYFGGDMGGVVPSGTVEAGNDFAGLSGGAGGGPDSGLAGVGGTWNVIIAKGSRGDGGGGGGSSSYKSYSGGGGGGFGGGAGGYGGAGVGITNGRVDGGGFGRGGVGWGPPSYYFGGGGGGVGGGGGGFSGDGSGYSFAGGGGGGFGGGGGGGGFGIVNGIGGSGGFGGGGGGFGGVGGVGGGRGYNFGVGGGAGIGGAIFNHFGNVIVRNSTLTANSATGGSGSTSGSGLGGAIFNLNGTLNVSFSTLDANTADDGGAIYSMAYNGPSSVGSTNAALILNNSILANSTSSHDLVVDQSTNTAGGANNATATIATGGKNLVMSAVNTNNAPALPAFDVTSDPLLGALANNGGPTLTMLPQTGSPAIDAAGGCDNAVDQRGEPRPIGAACDLGAVEVNDIIFRNGFEIANTNLPVVQCSGAIQANDYFVDDFAGSSLDTSRWTTNANGGSVSVASNSVTLDSTATQFPFITAISPIPSTGEFSVRWVASYTNANPNGDGTLVVSNGLPANNAIDDYSLRSADAWQDSTNGFQVRVRTNASTYSAQFTAIPPVLVQHDVEYCWLTNTVEIWADGVLLLQESNSGLTRPDSLWSGNPVNRGASGSPWNTFTLYSVHVRSVTTN